jgi:uncharacterized protein (DUF58 family)
VTRRLGGALLLGLGVTVAAVAFESRPLAVAGVGLLVAAVLARLWAFAVRGPVAMRFLARPAPATEGDRVWLRVEASRRSRVPVGSVAAHCSLGRLGVHELRLHGHRRSAVGEVHLGRLPRGSFQVSDAKLVLGDHLGLESVSVPVEAPSTAVVVHPRLVELDGLFSEAGRRGADGRRLLLRRPAGFDFHSVREYEQGESLRRVHWPTTARRGQLMVKELDDAPRDAVAVLLDCDPTGAVGDPPDSSFDTAVRAAGSVLRAHAARGRRATLVTTGARAEVLEVCSLEGDLRAALDALAAVEPDAAYGLGPALGREQSPAARAGELVIVSATVEPAYLEAILASAGRRIVSLVWVDAPSYAGRPTRSLPGLLRLSAAGIPVATLRKGDDLASALDASRMEALARA